MKRYLGLVFLLYANLAIGQNDYYIESLDGTKLHVREFGTGVPIIFLSGGPGFDVDYLEPIWQKLASDFRCVILDQRGTGRSTVNTIDSISMSMDNYVNDLEAIRRHLSIEQLILIGHSWGGMLSMEYAAHHPDKVKKMILLSPGGPSDEYHSYFEDNIKSRLYKEDIENNNILPGYFYSRAKALEYSTEWDAKNIGFNPDVNNYTSQCYFANQDNRIENLRKYKGVVNLIQGRQDPIGESTAYEIKTLMPQTRIHFIEKCGHFPWREQDEQVSEFYQLLFESLDQ